MRWRIGLLQDSQALERQAARDAAKREADRKKSQIPTVKTEAQTKAEEDAAKKEKVEEEKDKHPPKPKIKPLSETKAIESGANFISETFLFGVAAGLILFESWRSGRKEKTRRNDVADRLADLEESEDAARKALIELEREVLHLRAKDQPAGNNRATAQARILPKEVYEPSDTEKKDVEEPKSWMSNITSIFTSSPEKPDEEAKQALATNSPGPAEKVLKESDKAIEEKRRQRAIEDAEAAAAEEEAKKKRRPPWQKP